MSNLLLTEGWKESLTPGEKLVLIALCDQANDEGECFTLVSSVSAKCSMSKRAVLENMAKLEQRELIEREHRQGRSSIFYLYPGKFHGNPRRFRTHADSAPTHADSAPITLSNHYLTQSNPYLTKEREQPVPQAAKVSKAAAVIDLPDFMQADLWADIVDHRKSMKCPVTAKALQVVLDELEKHHGAGQNIRAMLNQAIVNGWKGLFPVKAAPVAKQTPPTFQPFASNEEASHATVSRF